MASSQLEHLVKLDKAKRHPSQNGQWYFSQGHPILPNTQRYLQIRLLNSFIHLHN